MADRNQAARGPQKGSFNLRSKVGSFEWGGMIPDTDRGSLPAHRLGYLINGRFRGGGVIPRGGQTKINASPLQAADASVDGLFDFQVGTRKSMYVVGDGCPGISSSVGFNIGWVDFERGALYEPGIYYSALTNQVRLAPFGSDLFLGKDNALCKVRLVDAPYGTPALSISGSSQDLAVVTLTGYTKIPALQEFEGTLYAGADGGAGASAVIAWDGVTKREDLTGINAPTGMGLWREKLILGYNGTPNHIRVRASGAAPGTWATVNPAAGTVKFKEAASYKDVFYFTSGDIDVWSYDGTTLQKAKTFAAGVITFGIAVFNGFLFVAYTTGAGAARIARYDGSAWVDVHKDLSVQDVLITAIRPMADYRGDLWVGVLKTSTGYLYRSPGTSTSGTWVEVPLDQLAFNGDIQQLAVF